MVWNLGTFSIQFSVYSGLGCSNPSLAYYTEWIVGWIGTQISLNLQLIISLQWNALMVVTMVMLWMSDFHEIISYMYHTVAYWSEKHSQNQK